LGAELQKVIGEKLKPAVDLSLKKAAKPSEELNSNTENKASEQIG
jgi:hypothetical protein